MRKIDINKIVESERSITSLGIDILTQEIEYSITLLGENKVRIDNKIVHISSESADKLFRILEEDRKSCNIANIEIFHPTISPRLVNIREIDHTDKDYKKDPERSKTITKGGTSVKDENDIYIRIALEALQAKMIRLDQAISSNDTKFHEDDRKRIKDLYKEELQMVKKLYRDVNIYQKRVLMPQVRFYL